MRSLIATLAALTCLATGCANSPLSTRLAGTPVSAQQRQAAYDPGRVVVRFKKAAAATGAASLASRLGLRTLGAIPALDAAVLAVPTGKTVTSVLGSLRGAAEVAYAEPDYIVRASGANGPVVDPAIHIDPDLSTQWGLDKVHAPQAWQVTRGSADVVVAVLDTGVDLEHPDLRANLVPGITYWPEQGAPMDYHGHGTHVAGIIAAKLGNTEGGAGVAPGCKIMPIKVMGPKGPEGKVEFVAAGLVWAADHGAKIANMSLGDEGTSTLLRDAVAYALSKDVVIVAASGNFDPEKHSTTNTLDYPAGYPGVMAVGATDSDDQLADFSFWGSWLSVVAPGVEIYSTVPGNAYRGEDGTSMASPFVAGVAALVRSRFPRLSGVEVKRRIENTAKDLGNPGADDHFGHGRIDAAAAVAGG
ncbi:MAG: peptidase [Cyanobacteria bacterium RYN_339]|nr:peptidase [Cyanobacteria bacterium RYN_339]